MRKALVVLSGGQDSTTCLALARARFDQVEAVTFDYGQRHAIEIDAARNIALLCGVAHTIIPVGAGLLASTSPLTDKTAELETYTDFASMDLIIGDRVEKTFVPLRNALFLTIAANRAVVAGATTIVTGVCQADNANYPDCRQVFIDSQQQTIRTALGADDILLWTPLMDLSKAQSIHQMIEVGGFELLAFTHTAYDGAYPPTGTDHASTLRAQGFVEAGVPDPLVVRAVREGVMELPNTANYKVRVAYYESMAAKIDEYKAILAARGKA
jgi:7-cyano-7-deazaguanine synthase